MDTSLIAAPLARAWGYLADLATLGRQITPQMPAGQLAAAIASSAHAAQVAPWGYVALDGAAASAWGLSDAELAALHGSASRTLPDEAICIALERAGAPAGELVLGMGADAREIAGSGFPAALRTQIELLIDLARRPPPAEPAPDLSRLQVAAQRLSGALGAEDLLGELADALATLATFSAIEICLHHPLSQTLAIAVSRGVRHRSDRSRSYRLSDGLTGWVARHRRTLRLDDFGQAPVRPAFATLGGGRAIQSYFGLPLDTDDRLLGTVELYSATPSAFSPSAERMIAILVAQASQALAGMQRHEQADTYLATRMQQLRALQRISRELTATLYLHNILGFALEETLRATGAAAGFIALRGYEAAPDRFDLAPEDAIGVTPTPQVYTALREREHDGLMRVIATAGYAAEDVEQLLNQPLAQPSVAEQTTASGESQVVDELHYDDRPLGVGPAAAAALAVPVYYEAQVIGVINLHSGVPFTFDRDALEFVRAVADQIALAIGNEQRWLEQRRQRDLLQQRANTLNQVLRIGQELRADRSLEDLLEQIAFSVVETTGFRAVAFYVADQEIARLRLVSAAGIPLTEIERLRAIPFPLSLTDALFEPRYLVGRCYYVPGDVMRVIAPGIDLIDGDQSESGNGWHSNDSLFIPLRGTQDQLIGLLVADEPYDHQRPTRRSVEALEIFSDQAALAIENATLLREARNQTEQATALYRASTSAASTFDLDQLLQQIYREIAAYLGTPTFMYVATYSPEDGTTRFELFMHRGELLERLHKTTTPKQGWTGHVIESGEVLHLHDTFDEGAAPTTAPILLGETIRSFVGIPIRSEDRVLGVLSVQSPEPNAFSGQDVQFLLTIANQLAIALDKLRLFHERDKRIAELDIINRIGRITGTTLEMEQMFVQLYECLAGYLPIDAFYLMAYNRERAEIESVLTIDEGLRSFSVRRHVPTPGSLTAWLIQNRRPLCFDDLRSDVMPEGVEPVSFGHEERSSASWLGLPLIVGDDQVVGVISVQSYEPRRYGERELAFMETVASQVALGLQNALLFNQAQSQLQQLALINRVSAAAAATFDFGAVFDAAIGAMVQASKADQARLLLYDREHGVGRLMAQYSPGGGSHHITLNLKGHPLVEWLDQRREPYIAHDVSNDSMLLWWAESFRKRDVRTIAVVPLIAGETVIGAVRLDFLGRQYQPTDREIELSLTIANQAAVALEKARLFEATQHGAEQLQTKVGELSALLEAARVLSSSLKPQEVLDSLMDVVRRQLQVNTVALWQNAPDDYLVPVAMLGIPDDVARTLRVPSGRGLTGRVAAQGAPLVVADVEEEGGSLYPSFNRANRYTSFMGVPVRYRDRTIGVLSVMTIDRRQFSGDEVQLLSGMADQAAIALENARLFSEREQRIGELTTLNRLSQAMSATLDLQEILRVLHRGIGEVLDISISFIGLYDRGTRRLTFPIARDEGLDYEDSEIVIVERADTLAARLILERRPILLHSLEEVEALDPTPPEIGSPRIASYLGVPIILGTNVLGMITVQSERPAMFTPDDQRFLETVASQAATAIANARLFQERERRLREVSVLQEIGSAITATLDLQTVLERLHAQIGRVIDVSTSSMVLYDAEQDLTAYPIAFDQGRRIDLPTEPPDGPSGWVIRNRAPLLAHTADEYDRLGFPGTHFGVDDKIEQSFLAVPIMSGDLVLGVIDIQSYRQHAFNRDDLRFMITVASQAAVAITNARLFQERGRRIEELATFNQIGQELSGVSSQADLLETIYRQTSRLIDTTNFYIALYDERRNEVVLPLVIEDGKRRALDGSYGLADTLTGHVISARSSLLIARNVQEELRRRSIRAMESSDNPDDEPKSWLGVPMIAADKVVGTIGVQNTERENAYSPEDVRLLETIAAWGATALENARLLGETRQSVQELTALYEVSVALAGTLDPSDIQHTAASSVLELLGSDVCVVATADDRRRPLPPAVADMGGVTVDQQRFVELVTPLAARLVPGEALALGDLVELQPALAEASGLRTLVGIAIMSRGQQIGAIWAGWRQQRILHEREISLISILTNQLSQSLARAQLLLIEQERRRVADTLRETAQMFTRLLTLEGIYELIFDQLARVLRYDTATLLMRSGQIVSVIGGRGFEPDANVEALSFDLATDANLRTVVETRQPMVLDDAQSSPYFVIVPETEHIRGWIAAPLLVDDEVIGLLCVDSSTPGAYSDDDGALAFALASQAAQAIRNARLYEEVTQLNADLEQRVMERTAQLQEEQDRLRAVHTITLELSATLELEMTLNKALELAAEAVNAQRGSIMLLEQDNTALLCRAIINNEGQVETTEISISFAHGGGLAAWVIRSREAVCIPDVRQDPRWLLEEGRADEVRSVIAAPLMTQDGPQGVLMLSSPHVDYFQDGQVQLLTTIANEIAIVIHNATLYKVISELAYDRGLAESQQREENSKNQAILQSLGEGVIVLDEQQDVVLYNAAAEQMLGIPSAQIAGQPLRQLMRAQPTRDGTRRAQLIYEGLQQGLASLQEQSRNHNRMLTLQSPEQSIALNMAPWLGPLGATFGSVVVLRDVTREIESDRAKREFISSVSHELRTPLTSIKGYVDLLLLGAAGQMNENQLSFLGVVKNNANRLMDLINDILEIGRIDSERIQLTFEQVNIRNVFSDVLQTLQVQIDRKQMAVLVDVEEAVPEVTADLRRITQVVLNLASNAVKYTFPQGRVTLRAFVNPAKLVQVEIEDTGVGISAEDQKNLFRRFQRFDNPLRDEAGGTGLGLSIAKSLAELHGGEMWVSSEPGKGSTFHFVLPIQQPEPPRLVLEDEQVAT